MNLTNEELTALQQIAAKYGKRVLVTRTQVGIGPSGVVAFDVVYTHGAKRPWQLRDRKHAGLKMEMAGILN